MKVYNPKVSQWIAIENAITKELKNQISKCLLGALSYYENI
ncbi:MULTISPECIES: (4Fe-4S)-binding protein [unclassified Polaribacter]|nr:MULTISPECIES: (4Fe-4S)-binding protein [unclassified Polaribacter]